MKKKSILSGWLYAVLWLLVSTMFINPFRIYLSPPLLSYYGFTLTEEAQQYIVNLSVLAQVAGLLLYLLLNYCTRIMQRHFLFSGLYILFASAIVLLYPLHTLFLFVGIPLFSFGLSFISIPAITSVCARLHLWNTIWEREIITQDSEEELQHHYNIFYSLNIIFILPLLVGIVILTRSVVLAYALFLLLSLFVYVAAKKLKNFGAFYSTFNSRLFVKNIVSNTMFWSILLMTVFVAALEFFTMFSLSWFLYVAFIDVLSVKEIEELRSLVLVILSVLRVTLVLFTAVSLNHVFSRRIILFCGIALSVAVALFQYMPRETRVMLLVCVLIVSSAIVPALLKSAANFMKLSMLPTALVSISIIGNLAMEILYFNFRKTFLSIALFKENSYWYLFIALLILFLSLLFFVNSYRKNLHIAMIKKGTASGR